MRSKIGTALVGLLAFVGLACWVVALVLVTAAAPAVAWKLFLWAWGL